VSAGYNGVISGRDFLSTPIVIEPLLTDPAHPIETAENLHFQALLTFKAKQPKKYKFVIY